MAHRARRGARRRARAPGLAHRAHPPRRSARRRRARAGRRRPLPRGLEAEIEELLLAAPRAIAGRRVDLAAELAVCLQLAGEERSEEHAELVALLVRHQQDDGAIDDPAAAGLSGDDRARADAHATATALVAFAGANRSSA